MGSDEPASVLTGVAATLFSVILAIDFNLNSVETTILPTKEIELF